jgi:hypothetical protein
MKSKIFLISTEVVIDYEKTDATDLAYTDKGMAEEAYKAIVNDFKTEKKEHWKESTYEKPSFKVYTAYREYDTEGNHMEVVMKEIELVTKS